MQQTRVEFLAAYRELFNETWRNIVLYGGRASGKSNQVAKALVLRGRQKPLRILCTREIQKTIKDSVHKLLSDIIEQYKFTDYEVQKDAIYNRLSGTEFLFRGLHHNVNEIKSTEGIDIAWVEEAQSVTKQSLDILTPTVRKPGSQLIFTFNRFLELDPIFVEFVMNEKPNTYVKQVNYDVLERAGLLPDVIKTELEHDRTNNPELFAHKWLGEPLAQGEYAAISRTKIMGAMQRTVDDTGAIEVGVDVARMGDDRTTFFMRKGHKTVKWEMYQKLRTTEVCDHLEAFVTQNRMVALKIDDTGVGGGVTDDMMRRGYNVVPVNFGGEPYDKDKYPNWISEAWFRLGELMDEIELPLDQDLLMELSTRQWRMDSRGRRVIESKSDYKKRGYRSPDLADACIIAFYSPPNDTMLHFA